MGVPEFPPPKVPEAAVVPGTFDPITFGHMDVINRAQALAPRVIVAVAASRGKRGVGTAFSLEERVEMAREALAEASIEGVEVLPLEGLLTRFCKDHGATLIVKGLRAATDFEYELAQADLNERLAPEVESVFVMSKSCYGFLSSSFVRELASLGADVSFLVPPSVEKRLRRLYGPKAL